MLKIPSLAVAFALSVVGCASNAQDRFALCPDFSILGKGTKSVEEARRCVRVMSARYSVSGESPGDIATAAIEFCRDMKIAPIFDDVDDLVKRDKLISSVEEMFRKNAIHTVVEMRAGECLQKPGLFDSINHHIVRP